MHESLSRLVDLSFLSLLALTLIVAVPYIFLRLEAKKDVETTPKVPMLECVKHGLYPASAAFTDTAVALGRPDLEIKLCPFCFDDAMHQAEKQLEVV